MTDAAPADIIAYTAKSGDDLSRAIGDAQAAIGVGRTRRRYSHVALKAFTPGFQHEAKFPFVGFYPVDITRSFDVWRLPDMTNLRASLMIHEAMRHHGDFYALPTLFSAGLLRFKHAEVCSQFVGMCADKGGYSMSKEGLLILPPDAIPDYPGIRLVDQYKAPKEFR